MANHEMALACAATGIAAAALAQELLKRRPKEYEPAEERRRIFLRASSPVFRESEPVVDWLGPIYGRLLRSTLERTARALRILAEDDWRESEWIACRHIPWVAVAALAGTAFGWVFGWPFGLALGFALAASAPLVIVRGLVRRSEDWVADVRGRMPYALDLMALVMEAGGDTLHGCLRLTAGENSRHPLGSEFSRLVASIEQGSSTADALGRLSERLGDPDVREVTVAMTAAEVSGMPLKECLRSVAERLRVRQVQWTEKASEQAKVHIIWPTMVIMGACLAIIVAPAVLGAVIE